MEVRESARGVREWMLGSSPGMTKGSFGAPTRYSNCPGVKDVKVNMVFDPPWDQSRMSDEARVALDMW